MTAPPAGRPYLRLRAPRRSRAGPTPFGAWIFSGGGRRRRCSGASLEEADRGHRDEGPDRHGEEVDPQVGVRRRKHRRGQTPGRVERTSGDSGRSGTSRRRPRVPATSVATASGPARARTRRRTLATRTKVKANSSRKIHPTTLVEGTVAPRWDPVPSVRATAALPRNAPATCAPTCEGSSWAGTRRSATRARVTTGLRWAPESPANSATGIRYGQEPGDGQEEEPLEPVPVLATTAPVPIPTRSAVPTASDRRRVPNPEVTEPGPDARYGFPRSGHRFGVESRPGPTGSPRHRGRPGPGAPSPEALAS